MLGPEELSQRSPAMRGALNLPADYPMVAPEYAERRKALALKIGLGRKPKAAAASASEPAKPAKVTKPRKKLGIAFN